MRVGRRFAFGFPIHSIVAGLLLVSVLLGSVAGTRAQEQDASALLQQAAATMATVQSFQFELSTVQGESTILQNLELVGVEGAVQRPDRFEATITAKIAIVEIDVDVIGIGSKIWVTDPMSNDHKYIEVSDEVEDAGSQSDVLSALLNPDRLLLAAVGQIKDATIDGDEKIDGIQTTRIVGIVDLAKLEQFATATPDIPSGFLILGEMPVTVWLDEAGHVISLELEGPLTEDESPDVVRRLDLYDFDEPVTIDEPPAA
jgi:hypothetical protein